VSSSCWLLMVDVDDAHGDGCAIVDVGDDGVRVRHWVGRPILN